jgi:hypothetical protein
MDLHQQVKLLMDVAGVNDKEPGIDKSWKN